MNEEITGPRKNCIKRGLIIYILNIITVIRARSERWAGHVSRIAGKDFVRKPEEGRLAAPKYRWETYIKMNFKEFSWKHASVITPAQYEDRWHSLVRTVMNIGVFGLSEQLLAFEKDHCSMELVSK
jgi:hypothetical protein